MFRFDGSSWQQLGNDFIGLNSSDQLGSHVEISDNGQIIAIGVPGSDENGNGSGRIDVFTWDGTAWAQLGSSILGDTSNTSLGNVFTMNGDGNKLYLSQTYDWTNYRHVISSYEFNGSAWIKLNAEIFIDNYVHSLTCSNNGQIIAIGVPSDDQNGTESGMVRTYNTSNGFSCSQTIDFKVYAKPTFLGPDTNICKGDSYTIDASNIFSSYLWSNGNTSSSIVIDEPGKYFVSVTNSLGHVLTDSINVGYSQPLVSANSDLTICSGDTATLFVSGANSFFWHHGKTSSIIYETPSITTTYLVSTTDQYGCSKTDSVIVNVINPSEGFNYGSDSVL